MRETMRMMGAAALLMAALIGHDAMAQGPTAAPSQSLPIPPPPPAPTPAPSAAPAASATCTQQDAKTKAERLLGLLRFLIARDPNRAQILLNEFQTAVQHLGDGSVNLAATCRSYDSLIDRATE